MHPDTTTVPASFASSDKWRCPQHPQGLGGGSASPSCSALAVRVRRSDITVIQIEDVGKTLLRVVVGPDVLLLVGAVGSRALPGVMNPAHKIVVICLLAHARQVRGERAA